MEACRNPRRYLNINKNNEIKLSVSPADRQRGIEENPLLCDLTIDLMYAFNVAACLQAETRDVYRCFGYNMNTCTQTIRLIAFSIVRSILLLRKSPINDDD